jgi:hypothetical protein
VAPCDLDPTLTHSVIVVVRFGSISMAGAGTVVGAFFVPEGEISLRGTGNTTKIQGSAIAKKFDFGGNAQMELTDCWVKNLPIGYLTTTPQTFSEVDR